MKLTIFFLAAVILVTAFFGWLDATGLVLPEQW